MLIRPDKTFVDFFNKYWDGDELTEEESFFPLFQGTDPVNVLEYLEKPSKHKNYKALDEKIKNIKTEGNIQWLKKINAIYHTRLSIDEDNGWNAKIIMIEEKMKDETVNEEILMSLFNDFVTFCKIKTHKKAYSYATKVFSFLDNNNKDRFPIMDSYVSTLLAEYLVIDELKNMDYKKYISYLKDIRKKWSDYKNYINSYKDFLNKFNLSADYSFKKIDIFLWLYADAIKNYYKKNLGIILFDSVKYKDEDL